MTGHKFNLQNVNGISGTLPVNRLFKGHFILQKLTLYISSSHSFLLTANKSHEKNKTNNVLIFFLILSETYLIAHWFLLKISIFKAALIKSFKLTVVHVCNVKELTHNDKPTANIEPESAVSLSSTKRFSTFQLSVLVLAHSRFHQQRTGFFNEKTFTIHHLPSTKEQTNW